MPTINFKPQFVDAILTGSKIHTCRFGKRTYKVGDTLYMQTGSRFKPNRFAEKKVVRVEKLRIVGKTKQLTDKEIKEFGFDFEAGGVSAVLSGVTIQVGQRLLLDDQVDVFEAQDGFDSTEQLCNFFLQNVNCEKGMSNDLFQVFKAEGQIIFWENTTDY